MKIMIIMRMLGKTAAVNFGCQVDSSRSLTFLFFLLIVHFTRSHIYSTSISLSLAVSLSSSPPDLSIFTFLLLLSLSVSSSVSVCVSL